MRRARNRLSQNTMAEELYAVIAVGVAIVLLALVWVAVHLGASLNHLAAPARNPVTLLFDLIRSRTPWPPAATVVLIGELVSGAIATLGTHWWRTKLDLGWPSASMWSAVR